MTYCRCSLSFLPSLPPSEQAQLAFQSDSELVLPFRWGSSVHKPWVSACAWQNFLKWIMESELFILLPHPAVHIKFLLCLWGILPVLSIIDFLALWGVCVHLCACLCTCLCGVCVCTCVCIWLVPLHLSISDCLGWEYLLSTRGQKHNSLSLDHYKQQTCWFII